MRKDSRDLPLSEKLPDGTYQRSWYDANGTQQPTKEYMYWHKINTRCKDPYQVSRPTYKGCSVSKLFSSYDNFVDWCRSKSEFYYKGYALDKDLLSKSLGIMSYSEDTCTFLPLEINSFLTTKRKNVKHYTGVSFQQDCQKFIVSCSQLNGKNKTLARVLCPIEGYSIYRAEKVRLAKILAEQYDGRVDNRVISVLSNFENYIDLFTVNPNNKKGEPK